MTGKRKNIDVLIFVEDPGPANFVSPVHVALSNNGKSSIILSTGTAFKCLSDRGIRTNEIHASDSAEGILDELAPKILLIGTAENPDSIGLKLIETAHLKKIPTVGVIDAAANAEYRFRGRGDDPLAYVTDWILVADDWTRDEFIRVGASPDRTVVCGHPHYDYVLSLARTWTAQDREQMRESLLPGLQKHQRVVVFLSEGSEGLRRLPPPTSPSEYTLKGRGNCTGRTEIIIEELLGAVQTLPQRPYLVLRLHPKDRTDDFRAYAAEFDHIDHASSPLELVFCADLVVGMTSMLLMEAALLGRRTLSILPRAVERDWLPILRQGVTPCVMYRADLVKALADLLRNGSSAPTDLCSGVPESSLARTVEFVERLLAGS